MSSQDWGMSGLPPEMEAENRRLKARQAMADAMLAASQRPYQQQMAGGYVVPYSPFEGAAKMLSAYGAKRKQAEVDQGYKDIGTRYNEGLARAVQDYTAAKTPVTVQGGGMADDEAAASGAIAAPAPAQAASDPREAITKAMLSQYPQMRTLAQMDLQQLNRTQDREDTQKFRADESRAAREARAQEAQLAREARAADLQARLADQRTTAQERMELQRQLAQMQIDARRDIAAQNASLRRDLTLQGNRPPPGYRNTPDGNMEAIPGGPADLKAQADAEKKAVGAGDVDVALSTLRDAYDRLQKGGGITSTKEGVIGNAMASASASPVGQAVGRMFGTQNQSARNDIAMARPALLAALMKATGMSAKQMDSNAELKLWLSTATDPSLDVESNRKALDNIERKYLWANRGRTPAAPPDDPLGLRK